MYDLNRFIEAQECNYDIAREELINGRKETHWMWFIFPQIKGLGFSDFSQYYGLDGIGEAEAYYNHAILGSRLKELCKILLFNIK